MNYKATKDRFPFIIHEEFTDENLRVVSKVNPVQFEVKTQEPSKLQKATEQRLKQRSLWSQVDSFLSSPKIPKIRQLFWWPDTFFTIEDHELHLAIKIIAIIWFYFIAMTSFLILSNALELGATEPLL